jgi:hypothetical protein
MSSRKVVLTCLVVLPVAGGLVLSGCAPATTSVPPAATSPSPSPSAHHGEAAGDPSARDVRLLLERLLGHHAILMVRLMRGRLEGEADFVDAADRALRRNTEELKGTVASVYGEEAGNNFEQLWTEHIVDLDAYSAAVADGDDGAADQAMRDLDDYAARYGQAVSDLTEGELEPQAVADGVSAHIHHLLDATDDFAAADYESAFSGQRTAYAAMFGTGRDLSSAVVTSTSSELPAGFDSPPAQLRSALGRLLGEHVELAFDATRAVVAGSESGEAAAGALSENTEEIITAMQGALGDRAAQRFSRVWADHIDALVQFSIAVADGDDQEQARARALLDHFPRRLGSVLGGVSEGRVTAGTVIDALRTHDLQLMQQVTAYAARDYETSHDLAYAGYDHMFAIADTLAKVLEGYTAGTSPRGGAATGGGGLAGARVGSADRR